MFYHQGFCISSGGSASGRKAENDSKVVISVICIKKLFKVNQIRGILYHKMDCMCLYKQKECGTHLEYCGSFSFASDMQQTIIQS